MAIKFSARGEPKAPPAAARPPARSAGAKAVQETAAETPAATDLFRSEAAAAPRKAKKKK